MPHSLKLPDTIRVPTFQELLSYLPSKTHPDYEQKRTWLSHMMTNNMAVFPDFVTTIGRNVHIIDIRTEAELQRTGIIPGSNWYPKTNDDSFIDNIARDFDKDSLIAIVDYNGLYSRTVSGLLREHKNFRFVAVLAGGIRLFKTFGFSMNRSTSEIKTHQFEPVSLKRLQEFEEFSRRETTAPSGSGKLEPYKKEIHTLEQVAKHVEDDLIQWIKMGAFTVHGRVSCIDGRGGNGCIGTPGGDMGELVLVLSTYEHLTGVDLDMAQCRYLFLHRLDTFGRFYLHTDENQADRALNHIRNNILTPDVVTRIEAQLAAANTLPDHWLKAFISNCPEGTHETILDMMTHPDFLGCGHLKLMILHGDKYKVRPTLVKQLLRAFYEASFWDETADCDYVVLSGSHEESGILSVEMANEIKLYTKIPLISPSLPTAGKHKQMFVSHPTIMTFLRQQQCQWLMDAISHANDHALELKLAQNAPSSNKNSDLHAIREMSKLDIITFCTLSRNAYKAFNPLVDLSAENHATISLGYLAASLPIYRLVFDTEHSKCKVDFIGFVEGHAAPAPTATSPEATAVPTAMAAPGSPVPLTKQPSLSGISLETPALGRVFSSEAVSTPHQFGNTSIVAPPASVLAGDNCCADHHGMPRASISLLDTSRGSSLQPLTSPTTRNSSFHVVVTPSPGGPNIMTATGPNMTATQSINQFLGDSNSNQFSLTADLHLPDEMYHQFHPDECDDEEEDGFAVKLTK